MRPNGRTSDYERLYERVVPSVVSVYVSEGGPRGAGSGFVYDADHVATNHHVVRDDRSVQVRFADGRWRRGSVVGTDAYTDLAAVRVREMPANAPPLPVAADVPAPGRPVAALGNPMGLDGSVTAGIVSGVNRSMGTGGGFAIPDVVQTDAAINPGNSGGPLVAETDDGGHEVVGVNRATGGDNIGFAVSARLVARVVPGLIADGIYRHPYLRVRTLDVTPAVAEANGLDEPRGALVVEVGDRPDRDRSAGERGAEDAALRSCTGHRRVRGRSVPIGGDVIVAVDGEPVRTHEELRRYRSVDTRPGDAVDVTVLRDGADGERTLPVRLSERPATEDRVPVR